MAKGHYFEPWRFFPSPVSFNLLISSVHFHSLYSPYLPFYLHHILNLFLWNLVKWDDVFVFDFFQDCQFAREEFVLKFFGRLPSVHDFQGTFSLYGLIVSGFYLQSWAMGIMSIIKACNIGWWEGSLTHLDRGCNRKVDFLYCSMYKGSDRNGTSSVRP